MWYESYQRPRRATRAELWWRAAFILLVAALAAGAAALWWHRYTGTPEYSLSQLGEAVKAKNYGHAAKYVDEERISGDIAKSLTEVLVAKYTRKFTEDPFPFTESRIELLDKLAPRFDGWAKIGVRNAIRLLLSGNGILTGSTGFKTLDVHNFSGLRVERSEVHGTDADVIVSGLPQPNPFDLTEIRIHMTRVQGQRYWRIEEVPDATPIFQKYLGQ
jgi:hypothetical protein